MQDRHRNEESLCQAYAQLARILAEKTRLGGDTHAFKQRLPFRLSSLMRAPGFFKLRPEPQVGIQRRKRTLWHQSDLFGAQLPHLAAVQFQQIASTKKYLSVAVSALEPQQPEDRECNRALAFAAPPHQPHNLAFLNVERDLTQNPWLSGVARRDRKTEQRRVNSPPAAFPAKDRRSASQKVCGKNAAAFAPTTCVDTAESEFGCRR